MKLTLVRKIFTDKSTIGQLFIDYNAERECWTLEDIVRPRNIKIYGKTAIPADTYNVIITPSNRFKRDLPLLVNVPNFEGIRIHPGNTAENTDGCILVGTTQSNDFIGNSRIAFEALFAKIKSTSGNVTITISNE